jgi:ABC-type dipeptide/oligopeptide/nickel transport system ATPase subunit
MLPEPFELKPAVREQVPLLVGIVGPSGTGKTFSALRLAEGIRRVTGGDIAFIDTEARRALHYAEKFRFSHMDMRAPFGSLNYLAAIEKCVHAGAKVVVVDSLSHEHSGQGGYLESHEAEVERLMREGGFKSEFSANIPAWNVPSALRRKLINGILQLGCNAIFCFRGKEKIKPVSGGAPIQFGWQPLAGEEFIYEMTLKCLLLPGADGVPTWKSTNPYEQAMIKCPDQFRGIFKENPQLSEDIGEKLAQWAAGKEAVAKPLPTADGFIARYDACFTQAVFDGLEAQRSEFWKRWKPDEQKRIKAASETAKTRVADYAEKARAAGIDPNDDGTGEPPPRDG